MWQKLNAQKAPTTQKRAKNILLRKWNKCTAPELTPMSFENPLENRFFSERLGLKKGNFLPLDCALSLSLSFAVFLALSGE